MEAWLIPEEKPLILVAFVQLISGERDVETRLRKGSRLKGPRTEKVFDSKARLGFWDNAIPAEEGYVKFQNWVESLLAQLEEAVLQGNWEFRGLSTSLPNFPQLDGGHIRNSQIDLLHNNIGEYRAVEITPRSFTMEEQCVQIMRRLMLADPARELNVIGTNCGLNWGLLERSNCY